MTKLKRYIVYAFYRNLAIKKRITDYSNMEDLLDYLQGLRFCETAYMAYDTKMQKIIDIGLYDNFTKEEMAKVIMED